MLFCKLRGGDIKILGVHRLGNECSRNCVNLNLMMISYCYVVGNRTQGELIMTQEKTIFNVPGMDIKQLQEQIVAGII